MSVKGNLLRRPAPADVHAWDCPPAPPPARLDIERYTTLFLRACAAVLGSCGVTEAELRMHLMR